MKQVETSLVALQKMMRGLKRENSELLLSMLTEEQHAAYVTTPKIAESMSKDLTLEQIFEKIHPSWLISSLSFFSGNDRSFYYSALPARSREFLTAHFNDHFPLIKLDPALQKFALTSLFEHVFGKDSAAIPFSFLTEDRLLPIAKANYEELMQLSRFLGLFDVVIELKKVIKGSVIKTIEKAFTSDEIVFINEIRNYLPTLAFSEIGLKSFEGDPDMLREIILERGLNRLAKALVKSSGPLLWYIFHTFDVERATILKKMMVEMKDNRTFGILEGQVIYTWNKICTPSHS